MEQVTNSGMWCCIISRRQGTAINTRPFFALQTLAKTKGDSIKRYETLLTSDSELRNVHFERCSKVVIKEVLR